MKFKVKREYFTRQPSEEKHLELDDVEFAKNVGKNKKHKKKLKMNKLKLLINADDHRDKLSNIKADDLLDINFFERCFFGKGLSIKDQLTFRIYARELLELIKMNLNRQISRK